MISGCSCRSVLSLAGCFAPYRVDTLGELRYGFYQVGVSCAGLLCLALRNKFTTDCIPINAKSRMIC